MHFDQLDAECKDCPDVTERVSIMLAILVVCGVAIGGGVTLAARIHYLRKGVQRIRGIWAKAGMQFKIKLVVGLYQCIAAIPSVFDVSAPPGLEHYTKWINILEMPAELNDF
eukprot:1402463-Prymnesium_polylepis.1